MRLFAISDLHLDYLENLDWLINLSSVDYVDDAIIVAGDISDSISVVRNGFDHLSRRFSKVLFVPGNHDLWVDRSGLMDSIEKLWRLYEIAESHGIHVRKCTLGDTEIIPLMGWYDFSFGDPCNDLMRCWMDFHRCKWPERIVDVADVADFFFSLNRDLAATETFRTVSFSHFLPRIDLMPSYIPVTHQMVYPVLGSLELDKQIRALRSSIHIYGHSHVNMDVTIDGIRYINNAFGYPSERWTNKDLVCVLGEV